MGCHFISIGPAKSREPDNAELVGTQNIGAFITAGGEGRLGRHSGEKVVAVKLNKQFCTYAFLIPLPGIYALKNHHLHQ